MKLLNRINTLIASGGLALALTALTFNAAAEDKKSEKPKPYPLDKCIVSDEKLGEMGKPFVFTYEGQEIKLCCKNCQKDFKKDPAKYVKKIQVAQAEKTKSKK
jgi:YHS domain-containing protein